MKEQKNDYKYVFKEDLLEEAKGVLEKFGYDMYSIYLETKEIYKETNKKVLKK